MSRKAAVRLEQRVVAWQEMRATDILHGGKVKIVLSSSGKRTAYRCPGSVKGR